MTKFFGVVALLVLVLSVPFFIIDNSPAWDMDKTAEAYVRLVLAVGLHDADYVDAYYGPPEWRVQEERLKRSLDEIGAEAEELISALNGLATRSRLTEMGYLRLQYQLKQLQALKARVRMLSGTTFAFDEEAIQLYDASPPVLDAEYLDASLDELDRLLPEGQKGMSIQERYEKFRSDFVIAHEKLDTVFQTAIAECRKRTLEHLSLPSDESFVVEYVTDKPWSGYNWYKGSGHSLIQLNTDLPIYIERAVDLAAHEGYPGHHVYNALLEKNLAVERGWVEFTVYALFSPQSLIAEGSANFGKEVVFTPEDRLRFEREVLFPLAGLDARRTEEYYAVLEAVGKLDYAQNEAARRYLNGDFTGDQAVNWLVRYNLMSRERAEQRLKFIEKYRSYVINYNLGKDMVRKYIEGRGGTPDNPGKRWEEFARLLSSPRLPSGLGAD